MKNLFVITFILSSLLFTNCTQKTNPTPKAVKTPFNWANANLYFLLTDRFNNGDRNNDVNFNRTEETAVLRGFEGGDIKGITQKITEGYFQNLGIDVIWFTPVVEQIHGAVDEGTGTTYGFHGYWTKDWTTLDPNFGSEEDLKILIETAHQNGIRILMDAVINHTGPVTEKDPVWPNNWVRTQPQCDYKTYETTTSCTLVKNLPDIKTESSTPVNLPPLLVEKWKNEGRYEKEVRELDAFFERTGYPRVPKYYIIKWLTDYILDFGIDGYRADTVKHVEETVWLEFKKECEYAFTAWKKNNPDQVLDQNSFFLLGEVYNFNVSQAFDFDFGNKQVNYYNYGFDAMINFEFKYHAQKDYETLFNQYNDFVQKKLNGHLIMNYLSSHDDGSPFDQQRNKPYETANKLLLSPGISQTYYGDELSRPLVVDGAQGDANLRTFMNWQDLDQTKTQAILLHWQKLGKFKQQHPAIASGVHQMLSNKPYYFKRSLNNDTVIIGLDLKKGEKIIPVGHNFKDGTELYDAYSQQNITVKDNQVVLHSNFNTVLLEKI